MVPEKPADEQDENHQDGQMLTNDEEDEEVENEDDEEEVEAPELEFSFAELKELASRHQIKGRSKKELLGKLQEAGIDVAAEMEQIEVRGPLPFDGPALVAATITELRVWAKELGVAAKKKDEIRDALKQMLPAKEQWASTDSSWENIRLPGMNGYGNIDVRDGVPAGLVHVRRMRAGPTAKSGHIPHASALVGFSKWRGQYSPVLNGIVVRKKDKVKLLGLLLARDQKKVRKEVRVEEKLNKPKAKRPWEFADLPKKLRNEHRDFSELPIDAWKKIFSFLDAVDVVVCQRVSTPLRRMAMEPELWRTKLFQDWSICESHQALTRSDPRELYLDLSSQKLGNNCACKPIRENVHFLDVYRARARYWLNLSTKTTRIEALDDACRRLGVTPHHSSKLVPAFHNDTTGDRAPSEVAAILKGVGILFSVGGHAAYSRLHETLHAELARIKWKERVTWLQALQSWEDKYESSMIQAKQEQEESRYYRYNRYDDSDSGYW